jgi:hypothetical protein
MEKHQVIKHVLKTCASNVGAKKNMNKQAFSKE